MSMADRLLKRAISLSKAGNRLDARQLLVEVLRQEPRNELAWLWYVETFPGRGEKAEALRQMLQIFPGHPNATRRLASVTIFVHIGTGHSPLLGLFRQLR